jgi:predicted RecA/RadA family phage recombinase
MAAVRKITKAIFSMPKLETPNARAGPKAYLRTDNGFFV